VARTYQWNRVTQLYQVNPLPAGLGILVTGVTPPTTSESTLIRTILHATFVGDALMGGSPSINEFGFLRLVPRFTAAWSDENLTPGFIADPGTSDPNLLLQLTLTPTITRHWTNANELLVNYRQEFPAESKAQRASPAGAGINPSVNVGLWLDDVDGLTRHTAPFPITWSSWINIETLWLTDS